MEGYFDYNATAPLTERAREALGEASRRWWHNPSGLYPQAAVVKRLLEDAREQVAEWLDCDPERVVFTAGATESNNAILAGLADAGPDSLALLSPVEHPSVREPARRAFGRERVLELALDDAGQFRTEALERALTEEGEERSPVVSVMAANNETGVRHPWQDLAAWCASREIPYHCDAAQWVGKLPLEGLGACSWLTASAHKFGGPKGCGFALIPEDALATGFAVGGPQEGGRRAGTEDYPAVAAMVAALGERIEQVETPGFTEARALERDAFEAALSTCLPGIEIVGEGQDRLWNTSLVVMPAHRNLKWVTALGRRGIAVSTGSACSAGKANPSHVMEAMGLDAHAMGRVLRFSGGWETTEEDWRGLADALAEVAEELDSGRRGGTGAGLTLDPRRL